MDPGGQRRGPTRGGADRWAPGGNIGDVIGAPMTAHFIGGAVIGDSPDNGVIDAYHRVYGYPGLHVVDGAAVSANLGVNPSLTITAQAERACALWPNRGEPDPRPALGERRTGASPQSRRRRQRSQGRPPVRCGCPWSTSPEGAHAVDPRKGSVGAEATVHCSHA